MLATELGDVTFCVLSFWCGGNSMNKEEYLENWRRGYEEGIIEGVDGFTKYIISRKTKPCDKFARKFYLNRDLLREFAKCYIASRVQSNYLIERKLK